MKMKSAEDIAFQLFVSDSIKETVPPEPLAKIVRGLAKGITTQETLLTSKVKHTDLLTLVYLDKTKPYEGPLIDKRFFPAGYYNDYVSRVRNINYELMLKRRRFKGHKWNHLGVRLTNLYYQKNILVIEPLSPQAEVDFSEKGFIKSFASQLEILAHEVESDAHFSIDCKTDSGNGRKPQVYIRGENFEGTAFLGAYYIHLNQDVWGLRSEN